MKRHFPVISILLCASLTLCSGLTAVSAAGNAQDASAAESTQDAWNAQDAGSAGSAQDAGSARSAQDADAAGNAQDADAAGNAQDADAAGKVPESDTDTEVSQAVSSLLDTSDMFSDRDLESSFDQEECILIQLNGDSAACDSDNVLISGTTVTIAKEGTYLLSGSLDDGMILVDAGDSDKLRLVLNGASVNSSSSAALYIREADKVFVTLAPDTENALSNGGAFTSIDDSNIDGAVFSRQDLTFNGEGSLSVSSPAGHGIVCKDDLVFSGGSYTIQAASHGLDVNDSVRVTGSSFDMEAGRDGIHAENSEEEDKGYVYISDGSFRIHADGDGISASSCIQIEDGSFDISAGGGSAASVREASDNWGGFMGGRGRKSPASTAPVPDDKSADSSENAADIPTAAEAEVSQESSDSFKGIKAAGDLLISGGTFVIDSADDSVHSNGSISVNGGTFRLSSGDDGFHADETLAITDGRIQITESYEGLEGLHVAVSGGEFDITASDDGINAAGGTDSSGFGGFRGGDHFGKKGGGRMGGVFPDGAFGASASNGISDSSVGLHGTAVSNGTSDSSVGPDGAAAFNGTSGGSGSVLISGGKLYVKASGDGIDANGSLEITGGYTIVCGPTQGDTATLDYDTGGTISGGTFIGTGGSMMAQSFSGSSQGVIAVRAGSQPAGTEITLTDASGNVLLSQTPELPFSVIILSSPELSPGETFTLTVGDLTEQLTAK